MWYKWQLFRIVVWICPHFRGALSGLSSKQQGRRCMSWPLCHRLTYRGGSAAPGLPVPVAAGPYRSPLSPAARVAPVALDMRTPGACGARLLQPARAGARYGCKRSANHKQTWETAQKAVHSPVLHLVSRSQVLSTPRVVLSRRTEGFCLGCDAPKCESALHNTLSYKIGCIPSMQRHAVVIL